MLSRTRLHPLKETQKQSRQHYKDPLQKHEKTQSASFCSAIVSKDILDYENIYCSIFPQALELQQQNN